MAINDNDLRRAAVKRGKTAPPAAFPAALLDRLAAVLDELTPATCGAPRRRAGICWRHSAAAGRTPTGKRSRPGSSWPWTWEKRETSDPLPPAPRGAGPTKETTMYESLWGNGNTGAEAGTLGQFDTHEEAEKACRDFERRHADNPSVGAWVRLNTEDER